MSGAQVQLEAGGTFVNEPQYTLFSRNYDTRQVYVAESFEVPFDKSVPAFGGSVSARIPPKGDVVRRLTVRSELPQLYMPLGPGYVYPLYTDSVDGSIYVQTDTRAIQPGDFVGYFNTPFVSAWATNFVGQANISVSYNSTVNKFVFTSPTYSNIFFQNENSASFWGFDIRNPDFVTASGYAAYNFTSGTLTAPFTLVQAGWIRGFTPPPSNGFSYVDSVATKLIKSATLSVGGQTIDRLTSERLYLEQDLGVPYENQTGLTVLEGKNDMSTSSDSREYYTKLTFNMDTLNMNELYRNDVRVDIEYEKFENLVPNLITTNSLTDGASYTNVNLIRLLYGSDPVYLGVNPLVLHNVPYKNYMIYVMDSVPGGGTDYWFYDTTKPIGLLSSYIKWSDKYQFYATNNHLGKPYIINNNIYYTDNSHTIFKVNITEMINGTATVTRGVKFFDNKYLGTPSPAITSDARYLYILDSFNMFSIGSNSMTISNVAGQFSTTANVVVTANIVTVGTSTMILSDNTAFTTFLYNYTPAPVAPADTKTSTITDQTIITSNLVLTANVAYMTGTTPALQNFNRILSLQSSIWIRYDTTKPITSWSSYDYVSWPGTTSPKTFFDFVGAFPGNYPIIYPSTDGRYIYGTYPIGSVNQYLVKVDTTNFLSESSYSFFDRALLINPIPEFSSHPYLPLPSDGRYIYFEARSILKTFSLYRYDSTKNVSDSGAWTFTTFSDSRFYNYTGNFYALTPVMFDGKHIYYIGRSAYGQNASQDPNSGPMVIYFSILRYDTTTSSIKDWIVFNGSNTAVTSSGTTTISMTPYARQNGQQGSNVFAQYLGMNVGSRYIYIYEKFGGEAATWSDFIQFDPLTMSNVLSSSSIITKYEKYSTPPKTGKMLYGQSDVETFMIRPGAQTSEFQLRFLGPVRELWISIDAPYTIRRIILRLNGEVLADDDQVTTQTIRAFESHTSVSNVSVINFALDPETLAPSGTLNLSRIASPMLEIQLTTVPTASTNVRVYSKSYNVFQANNGTGGLLFNSAF